MRRAFFAAVLLAPGMAAAFLGTSFKVGVRDAGTNQPLGGAFVVAREFAEVGKFHGSSSYCVRADAVAASAPWVGVRLPSPGTDGLVAARALEGFAYQPGYCVARVGNAAAAASHKRISLGMAPPPALDPSQDTRFELRRSAQSVEERLLYLEEVATALVCHEARWGSGSREAMQRLADSMAGEVSAIATSKYEKYLAEKVRGRLIIARELPKFDSMMSGLVLGQAPDGASFARDFLVAPADTRVSWREAGSAIAAVVAQPARVQGARLQAQAPGAAMPGVAAVTGGAFGMQSGPAPPPPPLAIHCRHGAPSACDLNERNASGQTTLFAYVSAGKLDEVRTLLAAGADPNVPKVPGGETAIEVALKQVVLNYDTAATAAQMVDLLAADPRTTLHAPLKEDFAADPSAWYLQQSPGRDRLVQRRELLARLPARAAPKPGCEDLGFERIYHEAPLRLRAPRP